MRVASDPSPPMCAPPLVSVLIPCYNHARYVEHCLDSVVRDGYPNLELHLIDDGSSDGSFEVATRWRERNHRRFTGGVHMSRQENEGLIRTLNSLASLAQGEFITMLASDDALLPGGINGRVAYLLNHANRLAVAGDAVGINENGQWTMDSVVRERHRGDTRALLCDATRTMELILNWSIPGPVYLARRAVLEKVGFYDARFFIEDRQYFLRLLHQDALGFIDLSVAEYRMHRESQGGSLANRTRMSVELARIDIAARRNFRGWHRLALSLRICSYLPYWRERARAQDRSGIMRVIMAYPARVLVLVLRDVNRLIARLVRRPVP